MRINRDLLRHLPHAELSEVSHAESFIAGLLRLPSFTRAELRDAALKQSDNRVTGTGTGTGYG